MARNAWSPVLMCDKTHCAADGIALVTRASKQLIEMLCHGRVRLKIAVLVKF
jgi:hypothetical protein